jgi:hypothetical protein
MPKELQTLSPPDETHPIRISLSKQEDSMKSVDFSLDGEFSSRKSTPLDRFIPHKSRIIISDIPNYMTYYGKTRHCCRGRCILGSNFMMSIITLIIMNIPAILVYSKPTTVSKFNLAFCNLYGFYFYIEIFQF